MGEVQELNCGIEAKRHPESGTQRLLLPGGDAGGVWGGEKPSFLFLYGGRVWSYSLLFISKVLQRPMYHLQKINDITRMGKGTLTFANF